MEVLFFEPRDCYCCASDEVVFRRNALVLGSCWLRLRRFLVHIHSRNRLVIP